MTLARTSWTAAAVLLFSLAPACGGAGAASPAAVAPPSGPGPECLDAAAAERTPKPGAPEKIGVSHILVRHAELDRNAADRPREAACLRALDALKALETGGDFDEVVGEFSDERGAATRGGSLGDVSRSDVHESFANAAWALEVDELSYVVETESGFHVILRTK